MNQLTNDCRPKKPADFSAQMVDFAAIKVRQRSTWASGDYAAIGLLIQIVGETLAEAVDLRAGERVLDVAAGTGNVTLAAARRFADVTSTDFVQQLLDKGAERAKAEGLAVRFEVADAEDLPYLDGSFDVVLSTFGVMFTPQQKKAASEMIRVLRNGGRIGMANWTPEGFLGDLFRLIGRHAAPMQGLQSPMLWGSEPHIVELFGHDASNISCERRMFNFRFKSANHWIDVFRDYYGPIHKLFGSLDPEASAALTADLVDLLDSHNTGGPNSLVVPAEYLEVVVTRK